MKRMLIGLCVLGAAVLLPAATSAHITVTAPANTSAPAISGQPYVGKTLTASHGGWANSPTAYAYQWARCDTAGNNCAAIAGATSQTYTLASADNDNTLEVWVTATNSAGTAGPANSKPTSLITPALPPSNTALPTVVGKAVVGASLLADPGTYSGGAVAHFSYRWQSCDPTTLACHDISGAVSQSYTVAKTDAGQRLRVTVTAINPFGRSANTSAATAAVTTVTPVTTTLVASTAETTCCQIVHLSGTASPGTAGEQITILAHQSGQLASYPATTATTDASGNWTASVTPKIATTYTAQTATSTSTPLAVKVHPRVGFGINGNNFSAKITGLGSFAGKVAFFQTLNSSGGWRRLATVVINPGSVAHFKVALQRGHTYTVRIYLPRSQAGSGYLDGVSHTRRVGGTSSV